MLRYTIRELTWQMCSMSLHKREGRNEAIIIK